MSPKKNISAGRNQPPFPVPPATILGAMGAGVIVFDRAGQTVFCNSATMQFMGWDAQGLDPLTLSAAQLAATVDLCDDEGNAVTVPPDPAEYLAWTGERTWQVRRADGTQRTVGVLLAPLRDPTTTEIVGAVHTFHDLTAWRQQEEIREEFLNVAGHELRAPLQPMLLASRFIQRWIDRPERRDDIVTLADQVVTQVKRMSTMVLDMLNMTRISTGRFAVDLAEADMALLVRNVVSEQHAITNRAIVLTGADAPLPARIDDERLWQAVTNLITNAIKYSAAPAPVTVTLARFTGGDGTEWARIAVRDEGIGIAPEQLSRVFERFFRASVTEGMERQQRDGLGLGLYITRAIVAGHGGTIRATSVLGEGSTFTIEVPLVPPEAR